MIQIDSETVDLGIDECDNRFHEIEYILYERESFKATREQMFAQSGTVQIMALDKMLQKSHCRMMSLDKKLIISYLQRFEFCPDHYFRKKGVQGSSLDIGSVVTPLMSNGYAVEFLDYYCTYRGLDSRISHMDSILRDCSKVAAKNYQGRELCKIPCHANQQVNLRYNYRNHDIISEIPKSVTHCISVEDGYIMAWGDFAQSDFRIAYNLFMRTPENDAIMNQYADKYEGLARIVAKTTGTKFDEEKFKQDRPLYKQLTLATVYGKRSSQSKIENEFIGNFSLFLEHCPKYVEFYNNACSAYQMGLPIPVTSYFGYEQLCLILYDMSQTIFKTLNCPIQTGTSEIVIFSINYILNTFYSLGYTKDDIKLYYTRHDEIVFKMRPEILNDAWVFKQLKEIYVDDWIPLSLTFNFGYYYGVEDDELMNRYNQIEEKKVARVQGKHRDYMPVDAILKIQVAYVYLPDSTVIIFYNETDNTVAPVVTRTSQADDVILAVKQAFHNLKLQKRYRGILVKNSLFDAEDYNVDGFYIKFSKVLFNDIVKAQILAAYTTCTYCKQLGIQSPVNPPSKSSEEFINSVKKFKEMM